MLLNSETNVDLRQKDLVFVSKMGEFCRQLNAYFESNDQHLNVALYEAQITQLLEWVCVQVNQIPWRPIRGEKAAANAIDKVIPSVKKREIDFCRICVIPTQTSGTASSSGNATYPHTTRKKFQIQNTK